MSRLFNKIRQNLLSQNRFTRYMFYAIGEIILIVVGILIALQINNWNSERIQGKKELSYLKEINDNLIADSVKMQVVLDFNEGKIEVVEGMMRIFSDSLTNRERIAIFDSLSMPFTNFQYFEPVRTAFQNMISAETIDLISDPDLKHLLTDYYSFNYGDTGQERIKTLNRKIVDETYPRFFVKEYVTEQLGISTDLPPLETLDIHKDQETFSNLYGMQVLTRIQDNFIQYTNRKNAELRAKIREQLAG